MKKCKGGGVKPSEDSGDKEDSGETSGEEETDGGSDQMPGEGEADGGSDQMPGEGEADGDSDQMSGEGETGGGSGESSGERTTDSDGGEGGTESLSENSGGTVAKRLTALAAPAFACLGTPVTLLASEDSVANSDDTEVPDPNGEAGTGISDSTDQEGQSGRNSGTGTDGALEPESMEIKGVTWESAPSYDGEQPGEYVFTAVLPEGYETAEGVEPPRITVTVEEEVLGETLEEEVSVAVYASMPADEVAPLMEQAGEDEKMEKVSSDNAGDGHKVRILWKTLKTVSKSAPNAGCTASWVAVRVPGMDGEQKFHFTKEMLTDSSKAYTLTEFALPCTYEDRADIFPSQIGIYSALSSSSGQFTGSVTLQSYDYIRQEWKTYGYGDFVPKAALVGGTLAEADWYPLPQPHALIKYVSYETKNLRMVGTGRLEKRLDMVFMDWFGVIVTEKSKAHSYNWELLLKNKSPYPSKHQMQLSGTMEGFTLIAVSGVNGIPPEEEPCPRITIKSIYGGISECMLVLHLTETQFLIQYYDFAGLVHNESAVAGSSYQVVDFTKVSPNFGRNIVVKPGYEFVGSYSGSDGKTYKPGDEIDPLERGLSLRMKWKPKTYRVTLDGQIDQEGKRTLTGNGQYHMDLTYDQKSTENAPIPSQVPAGFCFGGWICEVDGISALVFDKNGKAYQDWLVDDADAVLIPRWLLEDIRYSYNPRTDGHDSAWCYMNGFTLKNPPSGVQITMTKCNMHFPKTEEEIYCHGYDLLGWYSTPSGEGEKFENDTPLPLKDTTFYARWTPREMTLTLDANGGSFSDNKPTCQIRAHYEQKFEEISRALPELSRPNYDFKGWGYSASARRKDALDDSVVLRETEDFTLYAIWVRNDITIYLDADGGSFADPADARVKTSAGVSQTLPEPNKTGYYLVGWKNEAGEESRGSSYQVPEDAEASFALTAVWKPNYCTVYFDKNGAEDGMMRSQSYNYDSSLTLQKNGFIHTGYSFLGWNTKADGSGTSYEDQAVVKNPVASGSVTLYAQWKPVTCSVSFDPNGGALADSADSSRTVTYDAKYGTLPTPVRNRYDFLGWFDQAEGGQKVEGDTPVKKAEAHTLYAHWKYAWFTLSFDLQGGAGSKECAFGNMEGETKTGIALPRAIPERAGWEFKGWSVTPGQKEADAGYTAAEIKKGARVQSNGKPEVILYAVWYSSDPFVSYETNLGGTEDTVTGMPNPTTVKFQNGRVTVSTAQPKRAGYTFMGWALTKDGEALYGKPGAGKSETICSAVSVTLYAVWQLNEVKDVVGDIPAGFNCKYRAAGGEWTFASLNNATVQNVPVGGEIVMLNNAGGNNVRINKSLTLNLNGYTLGFNQMYIDAVDSEVTIKNGIIDVVVFEVSNNSAVVVDSIQLEEMTVKGSAQVTIQGKTLFQGENKTGLIYISESASVTVEYAEAWLKDTTRVNVGMQKKDSSPVFQVSGRGKLTVKDGYFYTETKDRNVEPRVILADEASNLELLSGYYAARNSGSNKDVTTFEKGVIGLKWTSGSSLSGRDDGSKTSPYLNILSRHWLTPGASPTGEYWKVYEGDSDTNPRTISTALLNDSNYASSDTRFVLLQDVKASDAKGNLALTKTDQNAVMDLNGHTFWMDGDASLTHITLKNGSLDTTDASSGKVALQGGTVEGSAVIKAKGEITLTDMTLAPGATFYVYGGKKNAFEDKYVTNGTNFGGTVLEQGPAGSSVTIQGYTYYPYVAKYKNTDFHSNYPAESGLSEHTEPIAQTVGSVYQIPEIPAFPAPAGYVFDHWNTRADGTGKRITKDLIYHDSAVTDIYAVWRRGYLTVTFDKNGGEWKDAASLGVEQTVATASRKVPYNNALGALPTVSRTGYGFAGWYTEQTGGTPVSAETIVNQNQKYFAHWTEADGTKYTVIWQGENVDGSKKELGRAERFGKTNGSVNIDDLVQDFDGYAYSGYTLQQGGNQSTGTGRGKTFTIRPDGLDEVTITYTLNRHKIAATMTKRDAVKPDGASSNEYPAGNLTITLSQTGHVGQDGSPAAGNMTTDTDGKLSTYYKYGSAVTMTASELPGYTFAGWSGDYIAAGKELKLPMPDREVSVTALYEQNACAVEKNLDHITVAAGGEKVSMAGRKEAALPAAGVPYDYTYTLQLTAEEGYDLPDRITLRRGTESDTLLTAAQTENAGAQQSYTRTADKKSGTVTVKNVVTPFAVTAAGQAKQYTVSFTGQHVTAVSSAGQQITGNVSVRHGSGFMVSLKAEEGYDLPETGSGTLAVTMGGQTLTRGTDYTYDSSDGAVYVGTVTGDVVITAAAAPALSSYRVEYYRQNVDGTYGRTSYETKQFFDKRTQESVSLLQPDGNLQAGYEKTYSGYAFDKDAAENVTEGTVDAAGNLVLKLYYKREEYQVSIASGYFWADGTDEVQTYRYGADVTQAIQEKTGYDAGWKESGSGSLSGLSEQVSFYMPARNVVIVPAYRAQQVLVSEAGLQNVRFAAGTELVGYYETAYSATIEPLTGYDLPAEITVTVGDQPLAAGDFTYDRIVGSIVINGEKVTDTIEITASGAQQTKSAKVILKDNEKEGKNILTADPAQAQVPAGETFNTSLTALAESGYALPDPAEEPSSLTVTMGGRTLVCGTDFTYSSENGLISVPDVVDDVVVTASPTVKRQKADYQIEHYKENLNGDYNLAQRARREGVVGKTVTAGTAEAPLKNYMGYTYDGTVPGSVASAEVKADGSAVLKLYYRRKSCILTLSTERGITVEAQVRAAGGGLGTTETVNPDSERQIDYKYGESVTARVSGTTAGNSFAGWYQAGEEKGHTTTYSLVMTEDLTLTAKTRETRYELVVNGNHGKSTTLTDDCEEDIVYGTKKTVGLAPDTGYHLPESVTLFVDGEEAQADACSYSKESETIGKVTLTVNGDSEIVFNAEPNHYKLLLDADGGKVKLDESDEAKEQEEKEVVYDAAYGSLPGAERVGYTFLGWFTEKEQESGEEVTEESVHLTDGDRTVYARWKPNCYKLLLDADGGKVKLDESDEAKEQVEREVVYDAVYGSLPEPERTGYTFKGWYIEKDGQEDQITEGTVMKRTQDHTLYACWRDETAPEKPVLPDGVTLPEDWTNTQDRIPLSLYDGVGVTELWVSVDGGEYTRVDGFAGGAGASDYAHMAPEGEHTYQFRAKDAAGNESEASGKFKIRLDKAKPLIGTPSYENKVANLWQWVIGKKSLIVHVPVTDEGSGVEQISYTLIPAGENAAAAQPVQTAQTVQKAGRTGTARVKDGAARIVFEEDFKGSIAITCADRAGNAADGVSVGTAGAGGVIVEDRAPDITTDAKESYKGTAEDIQVTVRDDAENAVTAGIAAVTWRIGDGEEQSVAVGTETLQTEAAFAIPGEKLSTGTNLIRIKASDNAGNEAAKEVTVLVEEELDDPDDPKPTPDPDDPKPTPDPDDPKPTPDPDDPKPTPDPDDPKPTPDPDNPKPALEPGDSKPTTGPDDPKPTMDPVDNSLSVLADSIPPELPKPTDTEETSMVSIETEKTKKGAAPISSEKTEQPEGIEEENAMTQEENGSDMVSDNDAPQIQASEQKKKTPENITGPAKAGKCGLCHICPTFLGVCYFIWLLLIVVAVILVIWLLRRRKREADEKRGKKEP